MADQKKPNSPPSGALDETRDPVGVIVILTLIAVVAGTVFERFFNYWRDGEAFGEAVHSVASFVWPISLLISGLFLIGIIYSVNRLTKLNKELKLKFHSAHSTLVDTPAAEKLVSKRWQRILDKLESPEAGDWKLAILEADIILEEIVEKAGYKGESLGEKLRDVEESDFSTKEQARKAHRIKNAIAGQGAGFFITQEEAKRVIDLYKEVFEEFKYI